MQGRKFDAIQTHMRDNAETNNISPIIFSRLSTATLFVGFLTPK